MLEGETDPAQLVIRIVGMIKTLRSVGAEVSGRHVGHCVSLGLEHGPEAGATAVRALADAIGECLQS